VNDSVYIGRTLFHGKCLQIVSGAASGEGGMTKVQAASPLHPKVFGAPGFQIPGGIKTIGPSLPGAGVLEQEVDGQCPRLQANWQRASVPSPAVVGNPNPPVAGGRAPCSPSAVHVPAVEGD